MNDQKLTDDQSTYPWMAHVHNWTKHSKAYKNTALSVSGWVKDEAGRMEDNNISKTDVPINSGAQERAKLIAGSTSFDVYGRLLFDFHGIKQYIPNNVSLYVRLIPVPPAKALISYTTTPCKLKIMQAKLYIGKVQLSQQANGYYSTLLKRSGFEYPCQKYMLRTKLLQKGEQNIDWSPYLNCHPRQLYFWQTTLNAYNGDFKVNPFNFQQFGLRKLQVYVNDVSLPSNVPMYLDENAKSVYAGTIAAINNPDAWDTTLEEFQNGYFLTVIDLTKDHSADSTYDSTNDFATLRILADYHKPLTTSVAVYCMIEYDSCLSINDGGDCRWKGRNN